MARTNKQPAFTVGGSFQALAVDHLTSDQSSSGEDNQRRILVSPPSKKARQRAKERAKKLNQITIPTTTTTPTATRNPTQELAKKSSKPAAKEDKIVQKVTTEEPINPPLNSDHHVASVPPGPTPIEPQPEQPVEITTSPTASTVNSMPTSPSTTDLDDEDSIELNQQQQQQTLLNGTEKETTKIWEVDLQRSTKEDPNRSYPESPATARPFNTHSVSSFHRFASIPLKSSSPKIHPSPQDPAQFGADHTPGKKWQTVLTRVIWSLVMVTGFITLMALGHLYLIILVFIIQLLVFREVTNLFQVGYKASAKEQAKNQLLQQQQSQQSINSVSPSGASHQVAVVKEKKRVKDVGDKNRTNKIMSWYFFGVANYFLYGESIIYYFKHISYIDDWYLMQFGRHHRFISLLLYLIGFLGFVTNLDRGHLRRQFGLFSWIHMSLLLIIVFGQFMVNNILEGLIWFWVPASFVIMNDVAAYVFGMLFGKHQLIKLSPKKTVEGFVGGFFMTVVFGVLWGSLFMGWNYMICPVKELGMTAFSDVKCDPNPVFKWRTVEVARVLSSHLHPIFEPMIDKILANRFVPNHVWWTPFQLHCLVLATFAGLVAPFGGFFASGFKRAFNVKDFGHTIPGHGGLTDRFDCQFIMGLFTYFYYSSLVKEDESMIGTLNKLNVSVTSIFEIISSSFNDQETLQLYHNLTLYLNSKGLLSSSSS